MYIATVEDGHTVFLDQQAKEHHIPHSDWVPGAQDDSLLRYAGKHPDLQGAIVHLHGNADAQALHVAHHRTRKSGVHHQHLAERVQNAGVRWHLDEHGKVPVPRLLGVPTPEEAAAQEAAMEVERQRVAEEARIEDEQRELLIIAQMAVRRALAAQNPPQPSIFGGAVTPLPPPDVFQQIEQARRDLAVNVPDDHPLFTQLRGAGMEPPDNG